MYKIIFQEWLFPGCRGNFPWIVEEKIDEKWVKYSASMTLLGAKGSMFWAKILEPRRIRLREKYGR